jgi:hypothetical protein
VFFFPMFISSQTFRASVLNKTKVRTDLANNFQV